MWITSMGVIMGWRGVSQNEGILVVLFEFNISYGTVLWRHPTVWPFIDHTYIDGILPKGPYPPCLRMADRALLAGYHRYAVEWRYMVLYNMIFHAALHWLTPGTYKCYKFLVTQSMNQNLNSQKILHISPSLASYVYCEDYEESLPLYNGTTLYQYGCCMVATCRL